MRKNANEIIYDEITILGTPALFTDWRVDRSTVPPSMFLYEVRHADEDWGDPCQLSRGILVNFYGSVLTSEPMELSERGYLDFDNKDWIYVEDNTCATISEFREKYANETEGVHA